MKRTVMGLMLVLGWAALSVQGDVIVTCTGETNFYGAWFNQVEPPFCQTFKVPAGAIGTQFEFLVEKGTSTDPNKNINIAVYSGNTLVAVKTTNYTDAVWGGLAQAWIPVSGLSLLPGEYTAEMWATGGDANINVYLLRSVTSTYADGEARLGWHPGTAIGENNDFMARVTVSPAIVEPESASIGWYDDRWGDQVQCDATAAAIGAENTDVVLPYLGGIDFTGYQNHVASAGGAGLKLIFEFNRYDVNTQNISGIVSLVQAFENHPGLGGWYTSDEPYGNNTPLAPLQSAYGAIRQNSSKPVFIAFNGDDLNHQVPVSYASAYDVMMVDHYPFVSGSVQFQGLEGWKSFITTSSTQAQQAGKSWWSIIQAYGTTSGYPLNFTMRLPTYTEEKFMTYWSVLQGAKGVMLWSRTPCLKSVAQASAPYPYAGTRWVNDVAKPLMGEFNQCAAAIQDGAVAGGVSDTHADVVSALYKDTTTGEYFLIAANSTMGTQSNVTFTMTLPAEFTKAAALSENREMITVTNGSLTDTFGDYQVHVYRLMADAQVVNTYSEGNTTFWRLADHEEDVAVQWFTVPEGTKGTRFEFYCEKGGILASDYFVNVVVYRSGGTYMGMGSMTAEEFNPDWDPFGPTFGWIPVTDLNLEPGMYYAEMFTNQIGFKPYLHAVLVNPSDYAGGYAAVGWASGTPTGDRQDFQTRLTLVPNVTVTVVKIPGDANGDKMVDVGDLGILAANYGGSGKGWEQGDFNGDTLVDVGDLGILAANYGTNANAAVDFDADYAKVFGTRVADEEVDAESPACGALGLPLVAGLMLMGLLMVKLED